MDIEEAIHTILHEEDTEQFDPRTLGLDFEKSGEIAFDRTIAELRRPGVSEHGLIRGLRALALLAREFAISRKSELLEFSMHLLEHQSHRVRSAALTSTIVTFTTMQNLASWNELRSQRSLESVQRAVLKALELGVDSEQETLGRRFLASGGQTTQTQE